MPRITVNTEDLIDSKGVAALLGLKHRETVSQYLNRYADMPRPVIELEGSRVRLWRRQDIERWMRRRGPVHPGRPKGSSNKSGDQAPPLWGGVR